ncbi:MAG: SDR family oxidoreductase [Marinosulfonomonas sp.]|nr:SDR family oxidoreductase [Marinosulfonomonas sp.]
MTVESNRKTAIVTGAAGGMGYGIAERLGRDGFNVVLADIQADLLAGSVKALKAEGLSVEGVACDIGVQSDVQDLAAKTREFFGPIDVLVNNAGISPKKNGKKEAIEDLTYDGWNRVLAVNLSSHFLLAQEAIRDMKKSGWGRIVNISSQGGRTRPQWAGAHYTASKSGVIGFTRALALDLGPFGVTANCIAPGRIITPMANVISSASNDAFIKEIPVGFFGEPKDIAGPISFLVSEDARFVNGAVLDVNGGSFMG